MKKVFLLTTLLAFTSCAHKRVETITSYTPVWSLTCERPNGYTLNLSRSVDQFRADAQAYEKSLEIAANAKHGKGKPLPTDFSPNKLETTSEMDKLVFNYHTYIDKESGALFLRGQVSCGRFEVDTVENRHYMGEGILNMPIEINDLTKQISPKYHYRGIGGYTVTVSMETPKETIQKIIK